MIDNQTLDTIKKELQEKYSHNKNYKKYILNILKKSESSIQQDIDIELHRYTKVACEDILREFNPTGAPM